MPTSPEHALPHAVELELLRSQVQRLETDLATTRAENKRLAEEYQMVLETILPPAPTDADWEAFRANPEAMDALIAQLEAQ